jgi:2'-5' RNA ligase
MTATLVHHKATLSANKLIRTTMDGRDYAVVPIVALVAGVVNGELVTADELSAFVAAWNGRPVPLRHPQDASGPISANSPSVIEGCVVGQVFKMAMDGDRLRGEMWLDVAKCERLGGDALTTLQRLEQGEVVEVSTAYFCDIEQAAGEFKGQAYTGIQRNLRPDHVALLPDEIGACSVAKGCGAGRTNRLRANADPDFSQSIMVAFYLRPDDAAALALAADALPAGSEAQPASDMHITLAYLGEIQDAEIEFNRVAELLANYAGDRVVVPAEISGYGRFAGAEGDMDAVFALVDSEALHQFRFWLADYLEWDLGADVSRRWGFIPHVTLGYVPSGAAVELPPMAARQSITLDRLALSWGELTIEFSLQGAVRDAESVIANRCSCSGGNMNEQEKKAKATKAADPALAANEEGAQDVAQQAVVEGAAELALPELPAELTELAAALREFGGVGALMDAVRGIKANSDRQKAQIVGRLAANNRCAFSKAELEAMGLDSLVKLEASIAPVGQTYVGRNGANVAANMDGGLRAYKGAAKQADAAQTEVKQ